MAAAGQRHRADGEDLKEAVDIQRTIVKAFGGDAEAVPGPLRIPLALCSGLASSPRQHKLVLDACKSFQDLKKEASKVSAEFSRSDKMNWRFDFASGDDMNKEAEALAESLEKSLFVNPRSHKDLPSSWVDKDGHMPFLELCGTRLCFGGEEGTSSIVSGVASRIVGTAAGSAKWLRELLEKLPTAEGVPLSGLVQPYGVADSDDGFKKVAETSRLRASQRLQWLAAAKESRAARPQGLEDFGMRRSECAVAAVAPEAEARSARPAGELQLTQQYDQLLDKIKALDSSVAETLAHSKHVQAYSPKDVEAFGEAHSLITRVARSMTEAGEKAAVAKPPDADKMDGTISCTALRLRVVKVRNKLAVPTASAVKGFVVVGPDGTLLEPIRQTQGDGCLAPNTYELQFPQEVQVKGYTLKVAHDCVCDPAKKRLDSFKCKCAWPAWSKRKEKLQVHVDGHFFFNVFSQCKWFKDQGDKKDPLNVMTYHQAQAKKEEFYPTVILEPLERACRDLAVQLRRGDSDYYKVEVNIAKDQLKGSEKQLPCPACHSSLHRERSTSGACAKCDTKMTSQGKADSNSLKCNSCGYLCCNKCAKVRITLTLNVSERRGGEEPTQWSVERLVERQCAPGTEWLKVEEKSDSKQSGACKQAEYTVERLVPASLSTQLRRCSFCGKDKSVEHNKWEECGRCHLAWWCSHQCAKDAHGEHDSKECFPSQYIFDKGSQLTRLAGSVVIDEDLCKAVDEWHTQIGTLSTKSLVHALMGLGKAISKAGAAFRALAETSAGAGQGKKWHELAVHCDSICKEHEAHGWSRHLIKSMLHDPDKLRHVEKSFTSWRNACSDAFHLLQEQHVVKFLHNHMPGVDALAVLRQALEGSKVASQSISAVMDSFPSVHRDLEELEASFAEQKELATSTRTSAFWLCEAVSVIDECEALTGTFQATCLADLMQHAETLRIAGTKQLAQLTESGQHLLRRKLGPDLKTPVTDVLRRLKQISKAQSGEEEVQKRCKQLQSCVEDYNSWFKAYQGVPAYQPGQLLHMKSDDGSTSGEWWDCVVLGWAPACDDHGLRRPIELHYSVASFQGGSVVVSAPVDPARLSKEAGKAPRRAGDLYLRRLEDAVRNGDKEEFAILTDCRDATGFFGGLDAAALVRLLGVAQEAFASVLLACPVVDQPSRDAAALCSQRLATPVPGHFAEAFRCWRYARGLSKDFWQQLLLGTLTRLLHTIGSDMKSRVRFVVLDLLPRRASAAALVLLLKCVAAASPASLQSGWDELDGSLLHLLCSKADSEVEFSAATEDQELQGILLQPSLNMAECLNSLRETPLHTALRTGCKISLVQVLLGQCQEGWQPRDIFDQTFVHAAVRSGREELVRVACREFPGSVESENIGQQTPMDLAIAATSSHGQTWQQMANVLVAHEATIPVRGRGSALAEMLLFRRDVDVTQRFGQTLTSTLLAARVDDTKGLPLHALAWTSREPWALWCLQVLIPNSTVVNDRFLHIHERLAADAFWKPSGLQDTSRSRPGALHYARSLAAVRLLVEGNADLNLRDADGCSVLHIGAKADWIDIVRDLVQTHGMQWWGAASFNTSDQTPLSVARGQSRTYLDSQEEQRRAQRDALRGRRGIARSVQMGELHLMTADFTDAGRMWELTTQALSAAEPRPWRADITQAQERPSEYKWPLKHAETCVVEGLEGEESGGLPIVLADMCKTQLLNFSQHRLDQLHAILDRLLDIGSSGKRLDAEHYRWHSLKNSTSHVISGTIPSDGEPRHIVFDFAVLPEPTRSAGRCLRIFDLECQDADLDSTIERIDQMYKLGQEAAIKRNGTVPLAEPVGDGTCALVKWFSLRVPLVKFAAAPIVRQPEAVRAWPFRLDTVEYDIISELESDGFALQILQGRAGTGKTVCLCEMIRRLYDSGGEVGSACYVTRSIPLCTEVESAIRGYIEICSPQQHRCRAEESTVVRSLDDRNLADFVPLVLTTLEFFLLMDACFEKGARFFPEFAGLHLGERPAQRHRKLADITKRLADYDWFRRTSGSQSREDCCHAAWSEIQTYIKGSPEALHLGRPLTLDEYEGTGTKGHNAIAKPEVYKLFKAYETRKHKELKCDTMDLTLSVSRNLQRSPQACARLGWLFVDEAQDHPVGQLFVMMRRSNRILLTGDTAQCVVRGINFSFLELWRSCYRERKRLYKESCEEKADVAAGPARKCCICDRTESPEWSWFLCVGLSKHHFWVCAERTCMKQFEVLIDQGVKRAGKAGKMKAGKAAHSGKLCCPKCQFNMSREVVKVSAPDAAEEVQQQAEDRWSSGDEPRIFQLTTNYRLTRNTLGVEHALLDLLFEWFPNRMDRMEPEESYFDGPRPLLFRDTDIEDVFPLFGAQLNEEQAVLVRSADVAASMRKLVSGGHVMTIEEAKGLDFLDIVIANFVSDSPANARTWRALPGGSEGAAGSVPFDPAEHDDLCDELKLLVTAVTRAKQRVTFFERDAAKRRPLFEFLKGRGLTDEATADSQVGPWLQRESTAEGWLRKGEQFMERRQWQEAAHCFAHSGHFQQEALASAHARGESLPSLLLAVHAGDFEFGLRCLAKLPHDPEVRRLLRELLRETWVISVVTMGGTVLATLDEAWPATVGQLKRDIAERTGIPVPQQNLTYGGALLQDDKASLTVATGRRDIDGEFTFTCVHVARRW